MINFSRLGFLLLLCAALLPAGARDVTRLDDGWRFQSGEVSDGQGAQIKDQNWQTVSIPHNWGWEDAQRGKKYYQGPGWYRRDLNVGKPESGRRYYLRFEAAGSVADVYLNGKLLGQHRGAFGAFCYELTRNLSATGTNLLAVRVSNATNTDVAPLSGDFCVFGGIYRPVSLIKAGDIGFSLTDHGSSGVAWRQTSVTAEKAVLEITAQVSNPSRRTNELELVARVVDAAGKEVATARQRFEAPYNATAPYELRLEVPQPHLWNGLKDPYLYRAVMELRAKDGTVLDTVEHPLGLRFYRIDPELGFFLNGRPYHLHGVNRHQDRENQGWAINEADMDEDLRLLKEMGCTVVRCAHYQHSDYFYSLCDQAGILVWAEIPQVDRIHPSAEFAVTSRNQLIDLVRQNINHPSIFAWSLFNEIRANTPDPHRVLQDLNLVAHGEDPTRPTIAATCTDRWPQMNRITDQLGWNIYPGWYSDWGPITDFGPKLEQYRDDSRFGGICISEYGAGANPFQHEEHPRQPRNDGPWHPEEYQSFFHEVAWPQLKSRPWIWGTFIWNFADFTSYWRHEGGMEGRNDKGLISYDRKVRKDAFYFYKANWNDEPMVYLTSRRFTERTNAVTEVKVYSNAAKVELFVNGRSKGVANNDGNAVFIWKDVVLAAGENRIQAKMVGSASVADECAWTLKQ
ncbi:MAG: glycoside hydrolase family 2 TIM barrel-domain containing protein [Verrucomicrobiota bacterium]